MEDVKQHAAWSEEQAAFNVMRSKRSIEMVNNVIVTFRFSNKTWTYIISVFTIRTSTSTSALMSPTAIMTMKAE